MHDADDPDFLDLAIQSIMSQTVCPDEVVLVQDGCLRSDLEVVLEKWNSRLAGRFRVVKLEKSVGLGEALKVGTEHCQYEIIARMDADDICCPDRFEKQLAFLSENPDVDVVGSWVGEFSGDPETIISVRATPTTPESVRRYARSRNPVNHPSVMLRKQALQEVGGYMPFPGFEDYYLWARMIRQERTIANIPTVLLRQRISREFFIRRGGWRYAIRECAFQRELLRMGVIGPREYFANILLRVSVRLLPVTVRRQIYMRLRQDPETGLVRKSNSRDQENRWN